MNDVNKVPASAGAQWLLDGIANLRRAPLALGSLGVIYGAITLVVGQAATFNMALFLALEVLLVLLGPLLMGGFVYAARSVAQTGTTAPAHLFEGMHGGRSARLLATLLPNIVALVVCVALLFAMVGTESLLQIGQAVERAGAQAAPDPAIFDGLPVGSLLLWFLLVIAIGLVASFFTFVALPEIMFRETGAFAAMGRSFRACVRNLPALLVFLVLTFIAIVVLYVGLAIVGAIVGAIAGATVKQVVLQLLGSALVMPTIMSAVYFAWRQMLSGEGTAAAPPAVAGFEA